MKLKPKIKAVLDYPEEQTQDIERALSVLADATGELGYRARQLRGILCVDPDGKEEEPL